MPLSSAIFPAAFGAFTLLTSLDADGPYMACVLDAVGPHDLDRSYDIDKHVALFHHLKAAALTPADSADSAELFRHTAKEYRR